jgi:hypothetical protein
MKSPCLSSYVLRSLVLCWGCLRRPAPLRPGLQHLQAAPPSGLSRTRHRPPAALHPRHPAVRRRHPGTRRPPPVHPAPRLHLPTRHPQATPTRRPSRVRPRPQDLRPNPPNHPPPANPSTKSTTTSKKSTAGPPPPPKVYGPTGDLTSQVSKLRDSDKVQNMRHRRVRARRQQHQARRQKHWHPL